MAGTSSVSGLVSGLDTSSIITQLMQVEAQTQTNLKSRLSTEQTTLKTLQDVNSAFASLATTFGDLASLTNNAWNPVTVTSSSDQVSATASATTQAGSVTFTVGQVATAHQLTFTGTAQPTDVVTSGSTSVRLTASDGSYQDLETGDGTMQGLVNALNASGTGVKATTVRLDDGSYRLQVTATSTGQASSFTLTNTDGTDLLGGATVVTGQDAAITIGPDTVHSATNTFTNLTDGLTITLGKGAAPGTVVTLDAAQDTASMTDKVKAAVDQVNSLLDKIDAATAYDSSTRTSGPLGGDATVKQLRDALVNAVLPTSGGTLAGVGIQLDRYGKLVFDADTFSSAYAADPQGVAAQFTGAGGFAGRMQAAAKSASDPATGMLVSEIQGTNSEISQLQNSIADWDSRLAVKKDALTRQFTAMETALSKLNSQSQWLSGQLAQLPSSSTSSGG